MSATCDNRMKVFADGVLLAKDPDWRVTTQVTVPAGTRLI